VREVNKKVLVIVLALAAAMLALPISVVSATKPIPVEGTFFPTGIPSIEMRQAGNSDNIIFDVSGPQTWTGSIVGSGSGEGRWVVHKASDPDSGHATTRNVLTLDVVFDGKAGTLTIIGDQGNWRIISGTGELANLRGQGTTFVIVDMLLMGYEGQVHFDP